MAGKNTLFVRFSDDAHPHNINLSNSKLKAAAKNKDIKTFQTKTGEFVEVSNKNLTVKLFSNGKLEINLLKF